ncbi:MAG: hypothetical protein WC841_00900 [Candidatus Shapirobacteria bacterium]|jgi:hypothetical protein
MDETDISIPYGANFNPDHHDRVAIRVTDGAVMGWEQVPKDDRLPPYVQLSREVRTVLSQSVEKNGWPELPNRIESVESLFEKASEAVARTWQAELLGDNGLFQNKCIEWAENITGDSYEAKSARALLLDAGQLETKLRIRQFGSLESIKSTNPEIWRCLILTSSERQSAGLTLVRHWLKAVPEEQMSQFGMSKNELNLFLDIAGVVGKYIDHAYIKQIELAGAPGGSSVSPNRNIKGAEFLYDVNGKDGPILPFIDVFPEELTRLVDGIKMLADKTELMVDSGQLPADKYQGAADYLRQFADVYASTNTRSKVNDDPEELEEKEVAGEYERLIEKGFRLLSSGCPIALIPQGTPSHAGEAYKVDLEIRLASRTEETQKIDDELKELVPHAQTLVDSHIDILDKPYRLPDQIITFQPFAFGPNTFWYTRGDSIATSEGGAIITHSNAVEDVAKTQNLPVLGRVFNYHPDSAEYSKAEIVETVAHEIAHCVMGTDDKNVNERIGQLSESEIVEELKAETVAMKLLWETKLKSADSQTIELQFMAKVATLCDYLKNKSASLDDAGAPYYYCGVAIISELLNQGIIVGEGEGYRVTDCRKGCEVIAAMGDNILNKFYFNPETKPENVQKYVVSDVTSKTNDNDFQKFLSVIKQ